MKVMLIPALLSCLLCCATQTSGVTIEANPASGLDGFIHTELEKTVTLTCKNDNASLADIELVWLRNGALVSLKDGNKKGESRVCISPVILEDKDANFTCHLQSSPSDKDTVVLNITYPPDLMGSDEIEVEEEAQMVLLCNIDAHPQVTAVRWILNGTEVNLKAGRFSLTSDGLTSRLSADKVQRSLHEGVYTCEVDSPMYGLHTKEFKVDVKDKTMKFPLWPMVAGIVVVCLTTILAIAARWRTIAKCCKK